MRADIDVYTEKDNNIIIQNRPELYNQEGSGGGMAKRGVFIPKEEYSEGWELCTNSSDSETKS